MAFGILVALGMIVSTGGILAGSRRKNRKTVVASAICLAVALLTVIALALAVHLDPMNNPANWQNRTA